MSKVMFETGGDGIWSDVQKQVPIKDMKITYISDDFNFGDNPDYGELRVYFDSRSWNVARDGLIYTDRKFLKELQKFLSEHGLAGDDVSYTEQGMQGDDYVSCGVGKKFLKTWQQKFNTDWEEIIQEQEKRFQKIRNKMSYA